MLNWFRDHVSSSITLRKAREVVESLERGCDRQVGMVKVDLRSAPLSAA